jgi:hypothetical protein
MTNAITLIMLAIVRFVALLIVRSSKLGLQNLNIKAQRVEQGFSSKMIIEWVLNDLLVVDAGVVTYI